MNGTILWSVSAVALCLGLAGCARSRGTDVSPPPASAGVAASVRAYPVPPAQELRARLTRLQYEVTQNAATEPPFQNAYFNNHEAGIYVDIVTGEPLFSSQDKFESGTGWPSFDRPIEGGHVTLHSDFGLGGARTEVVSKSGRSHLGHVFDDGPPPTGMRYCINSASLRFVPAARLTAEGYGDFASRFAAGSTSAPPPAASSNACAIPPPGETPGCHTTLDVAIFARSPDDDRIAKPVGVLDVVSGFEGNSAAVEVTFDPEKLSYEDLLAAWTKGRESGAKVYARDDAQKQAAKARSLSVTDATPFRRQ